MPEGIALSPSAAKKILREMAERNQSLDLVRILEEGEDRCRSRFIQVPDGRLAVEVPSRLGHLVPVRTDERIEAFFRMGNHRYWFASTVTGRRSVQLSEDMAISVLQLAPPKRVEQRQRRRHFRIDLHEADRLTADLWRIDADSDNAPVALPSMEVLDLSAGGMRLLHDQPEDCPTEQGDTLRVSVQLDDAAPRVILDARAMRAAGVVKGITHLGLEFVGLDDSPKGRATRDALSRFVTKREREELRRTRGTR